MAIITISRGSYFRGKEIAQKVAQKLGYACISREDLLKNSKEFNIPEIKLLHAFEDGPSISKRFTHGRERYIAYIKAALLNNLKKDNLVYHGFAFHCFVKDIPCTLKVRITAELEDRIGYVMERDKISKRDAERFIRKVDEQRRKWSRRLYGIDPSDPSLYDLVLHIGEITVADAVNTICHVIGFKQYQTTLESKKVMSDLALAAEVKAALMDLSPNIGVSCENGIVTLETDDRSVQERKLITNMMDIDKTVRGIKGINVVVEGFSHDSSLYRSNQPTKCTREIIGTYFSELG